MTFTPDRVDTRAKELAGQFEFDTQLDADLATGVRGGNKARLIARCYVAMNERLGRECGPKAYVEFRAAWIKKTFAQLHDYFDQYLPAQYRTN